jgi:RNA-binding protein
MKLTGKDRRKLRSLGHALRPVVLIGREGLTEPIFDAIEAAHHGSELIKLKILEPGQVDRKAIATELNEQTHSEMVGMVGGVLLLYRRNHKDPEIRLPSDQGRSDPAAASKDRASGSKGRASGRGRSPAEK